MTTAEYCVGIIAACSFAFLLYKALKSGWVTHLVRHAITAAFHVIPL